MMTWLEWAIDDPAPGNCGYSALNIPCELADSSLRRGMTIHSVEGWFTYTNPSAVMRARGNSWGVTIMRSGQVWRHRPRPTFVNWHAGGPAQNIGTDGIEMEGKNQPWTPEQRASLIRVLRETWGWFGWTTYTLAGPTDRVQGGIRQALLAHGYGSLWEHNWFDYTSCPSGRNHWPWLMPELPEKEDEMAETISLSDETIQKQKQAFSNVLNEAFRSHLKAHSAAQEARSMAERNNVIQQTTRLIKAIEAIGGGTGAGLTNEEAVEAAKQAAREGTG